MKEEKIERRKVKGIIAILLMSMIAISVIAMVSASMPTPVRNFTEIQYDDLEIHQREEPVHTETLNLSVRAENDYNWPGYPTEIDVYADDTYTGTLNFSENDNSWTVESLQIPSDTRTIRLVFAHDWCAEQPWGDGGDLNAYIDWLEIDCIHIEAENFDRTGKDKVIYYDGDWEPYSFESYNPEYASFDHYGVEHIYYEPLAEGIIIEMSQSPSWVEYDIPTILTISTDKQVYNISEIVRMTIGINRSEDHPQVMSLEIELKEPCDEPDVLYKSPPFVMPAVFQWNVTVPMRIDYSIWSSGSKYCFKAILRDPITEDIIAKDRTSFIIDDVPWMEKLKSLEKELMKTVEEAEL
jgi:hypothetical protein